MGQVELAGGVPQQRRLLRGVAQPERAGRVADGLAPPVADVGGCARLSRYQPGRGDDIRREIEKLRYQAVEPAGFEAAAMGLAPARLPLQGVAVPAGGGSILDAEDVVVGGRLLPGGT